VLELLWLIPLLPLAGVALNIALGDRMGRAAGAIASAMVAGSFGVAAGAFAQLLARPEEQRRIVQTLWTWFQAGSFEANVGLLFDPLSATMCLVVTFVGFLIHVYSTGYMHGDPGYRRYFVYLNLFTFSMLTLVLADNFLLMFVGWEGVGLCSFLLIGFWYERHSAADAAKKAFVVNRIGDFGFLLGVLLLFVVVGSVDYGHAFALAPERLAPGSAIATAIALLLFVGATGKSAQIPLHVWLPDAMEGPTPVSALIHAATMVTAGVYMVARCHVLFELAPAALTVVAVIGAATAAMAATIAFVQADIKRVLAYSTVSQLGYMFLACGVGAYAAGIFHLVTHAFFKALLFLGAGSVIHALSGEQDLRRMGGLRAHLPWTHRTMLVACLAIAGIPPLAGFFSKDAILAAAFQRSPILWAVGLAVAGGTAFYMFRMLFLTFYGKERLTHEAKRHLHESPPSMRVPLVVLAFFSATAGLLAVPIVPAGDRFGEFLRPSFSQLESVRALAAEGGASAVVPSAQGHAAVESRGEVTETHGEGTAHHLPLGLELALMAASVIAALLGIFFARTLYTGASDAAERLGEGLRALHRTLWNKYWVDEIYRATIVRPLERISIWLWRIFDVRLIDGLVDATGGIVVLGGTILRLFQNGYVGTYAFFFVIGVVLLLAMAAGR
jgi:NADH-quinone oxidoreductase subunit L